MCRYRRSIFLCNHTQTSAEPFIICPTQQRYMSGASPEPCGVAETHTCSTIRVCSLCQPCEAKKARTDNRVSDLKDKIAQLRENLGIAHEDSTKRIDEASLKSESQEDVEKERVDPVQEFLKMKKSEKYAHLMMLGT